MSRSAGVALASAAVLGVIAFLVFDAAWEFGADDGWGLGARGRPVLHGLGIALGVVWLGVFVWALIALARLVRATSSVAAALGMALSGIGAAAGVGVTAFQVYLLAWLAVTSDVEGDAFLDVFLRVRDLEIWYLAFAAVAGLALAAALTVLAYGAARAGVGSRLAAWAVVVLPVLWNFVDWVFWLYVAAVLVFALSLIRARGRPAEASAVAA